MRSIDVYIPNPNSTQLLGVDPKSGIVGRPWNGGSLLVYYEGNRYNAVNIVTFADRCMIAAGRMEQNAPTIAKCIVSHDAAIRVGSYLPEYRRVELDDGASVTRLAAWLQQGHFAGDVFVPELDADDLRCSSWSR